MNDVAACLIYCSGVDRATTGLLGEARRLADSLTSGMHAIIIGPASPGVLDEAARVSDSVILADIPELREYSVESALSALTSICKQLGPLLVLLGNDCYSQELAARLAHRLGGSAVGDGIAITVDGGEDGSVKVTRSVYGGKAVAVVALKKLPGVVWLRARSFAPAHVSAPRKPEGTTEISYAMVDLPADSGPKIVEREGARSGEARLEDAAVIVSGGRGLGGPEPFEDLKQIAALLDAQVAASRAACDAGWVPPSFQVGQTGKKVAPGLYVAVAISGASQHLAGISDAKVIAAINTDIDAPIFKHSAFGIVEDFRKVLPLLKQQLASRLKS